jgi:hypothetical protein
MKKIIIVGETDPIKVRELTSTLEQTEVELIGLIKNLMVVGEIDPIKVRELVAVLEKAGVELIGENGTFYANVTTLSDIATVAHDAGFSIEVLGSGRCDSELQLRVSQNVDTAPIDRKTLRSGKLSVEMGPRQDVGH